jgi:hypothetical protein
MEWGKERRTPNAERRTRNAERVVSCQWGLTVVSGRLSVRDRISDFHLRRPTQLAGAQNAVSAKAKLEIPFPLITDQSPPETDN